MRGTSWNPNGRYRSQCGWPKMQPPRKQWNYLMETFVCLRWKIFLKPTRYSLGKSLAVPMNAHRARKPSCCIQISHEGLRGPVSIPSGEAQARKLLTELEHRLVEGRRKMIALAEERAGTEKLREQVIETLYRWFIHGRSRARQTSNRKERARLSRQWLYFAVCGSAGTREPFSALRFAARRRLRR